MLNLGKFLKYKTIVSNAKSSTVILGRKQFISLKYFLYSSSSHIFNPSIPGIKKEDLLNAYDKYKSLCQKIEIKSDLANPKGVFCNNEIDLSGIQVYGFDYDYTLAYYNVSLYNLIFNLARDILVDNFKYPNELRNLKYLPHFPIRGLHLDKRKGWLMKIDSYQNIQLGSVYYGMNPVDNDEVIKFYGGVRLNIEDIGYSQTSSTLHQYVDLFCLPEISLLASTFQFFCDKNIQFTPEYIFQDVNDAVNTIHRNQILHKKIVQAIDDYLLPIEPDPNSSETQYSAPSTSSSIYVKEFLQKLIKNGKKTFLITNSPYWFVNFGMQSLLGSDWTNLFDLIICNARKPYFFTSKSKQFRRFSLKTNAKTWEQVHQFKKNEIYYEGNLFQMLEKTGWRGNSVLYFGDHIYGDLAEPFLKHGWRTGAIINEIEQEIEIFNDTSFQRNMLWLNTLEKLIQKSMFLYDDETNSDIKQDALDIKRKWIKEREELRLNAKNAFNPYFGSVFRTSNSPSFYSRRLSRFADIYTSNVTNLLNYPIDYHFIPRRVNLAHETSKKLDIRFEC